MEHTPMRSGNVLLNTVPEEDAAAVVVQALRLQAEAAAQDRKAGALSETLAELDVPEEYLRQAVADYRRRKQNGRRRRIRIALGTLTALVGAAGLTYWAVRPPTPVRYSENFNVAPERRWTGHTNPESVGEADFTPQADGHQLVAWFDMPRARPDARGHWYGRIETDTAPLRLAGDHTARFGVNGSTVRVRLLLENGTDRWVSPAVSTDGGIPFETVPLRLQDFRYQIRTPAGGWRPAPPTAVGTIDRIAFEINDGDNPAMRQGGFAVDDVAIE